MRTTTVSDFFATSVRDYSVHANVRAIPDLIDGFKPSQRKVIFGTLKKAGTIPETGIKVSQLAAQISLCVAADTQINIFGRLIRVDTLYELLGPNASFEIDAIDPKSGQLIIAQCNGILEKGEETDFIEIELANGELIKVTPRHKLLTDSGWKKACELTTDDELIDLPVINKNTTITEMIDELYSGDTVK
jgi:hypothetical protein